MTTRDSDRQQRGPRGSGGATRWLGVGGGVALALAGLMLLLAWQRETDESRKNAAFKAHVDSEMNRIEAEASRMEREAGQ